MMSEGLMVADALVLDNRNKDVGEDGKKLELGDEKHPFHNLAHPTVWIFENDEWGKQIWGQAFTAHTKGHGPLLAQLSPGVSSEPKTLMIPEVTIQSLGQALVLWGYVQEAVGHAITDSVGEGKTIPEDEAGDYLVLVQVYHDPQAFDMEMLWATQYAATKMAFENAWNGQQSAEWIQKNVGKTFHPFSFGSVEAVKKAKELAGTLGQTFVRPEGVTVEA